MYFRCLIIISLCIVHTLCAALVTKTLEETIDQECPNLKKEDLQKLSNYNTILKACHSWSYRLPPTDKNDKRNLLCWVYYNAFTTYCKQQNASYLKEPIYTPHDLDETCNNVDIIPKETKADNIVKKLIPDKETCKQVCSDGVGLVEYVCAMSYYYSNPLKNAPALPQQFNSSLEHNEKLPTVPLNTLNNLHPVNPPKIVSQKPNIPKPEQIHAQINQPEVAPPFIPAQIQVTPSTPNHPEVKASNVAEVVHAHIDHIPILDIVPPVALDPKHTQNKGDNQTKIIGNVQKKTEIGDHVAYQVPKEAIENDNVLPPKVEKTEDSAKAPEIEAKPNVKLVDPKEGEIDNKPYGDVEEEEQREISAEQTDDTDSSNIHPENPGIAYSASNLNGDSYFFTYFMVLCLVLVAGYVLYHNKQRILALLVEGRKGKRHYRSRRTSSASYHKLDSNLEEAMLSSSTKNTSNVIY